MQPWSKDYWLSFLKCYIKVSKDLYLLNVDLVDTLIDMK